MYNLFNNFDNHVKELNVMKNHKYCLIKLIIEYYMKILVSYKIKIISQK